MKRAALDAAKVAQRDQNKKLITILNTMPENQPAEKHAALAAVRKLSELGIEIMPFGADVTRATLPPNASGQMLISAIGERVNTILKPEDF